MNYDEYKLSFREIILNGLIILVAFMVIGKLFYGTVLSCVVLLPLFYPIIKIRKKQLIKKRKEQLEIQFKDMLVSMADALTIGYSIENAIKESYQEMLVLYGSDSYICRELKTMMSRIKLNVTVESAFKDLANRTKIKDIELFVSTFSIAKRRGGNMVQIIRKTADNVRQKSEVKEEIMVSINAKRLEQKIMSVVPVLIVVYMCVSSPGFLDVMYQTVMGKIIMTIAIILYALALKWAQNIMNIEV